MKSFIFLFLFLCVHNITSAQTNPECEALGITDPMGFITVPSAGSAVIPGADFCLEFQTDNFEFISSFQFTFNWDPTELKHLDQFQVNGGLTGGLLFNETRVTEGVLPIIWTNANADGQTLPDGRPVFQICFTVCADPTECIELGFNNNLAPFLPGIEVGYNTPDGTCQINEIWLDGNPDSTCLPVACEDMTILDLAVCNNVPGGQGGTATFSICGGVGPYTYTINDNAFPGNDISADYIIEVINNLPVGVYDLEVFDSAGLSVTTTFEIISGPLISIFDTTSVLPICSATSNGSFTVGGIEGGVPNYDLRFSNGLTSLDFTAGEVVTFDRLGNGNYTLTVTDDAGCEAEFTTTIYTPPIELNAVITPPSCPCANDGFIGIYPTGGTPFPGGEYIINGFSLTELESNSPFEDVNFGFGTWNVTVSDASNCPVEMMFEIPVTDTIAYELTELVNVSCRGDSTGYATVTVTDAGRYQFFVSRTPNIFNGCSLSTFFDPVPSATRDNNTVEFNDATGLLPAGTYYVGIQSQDNGCTQVMEFTISEPFNEFSISGTSVPADCGGATGAAVINIDEGFGPFVFSWDDDPAITSDSRLNLTPGIYIGNAEDNNGCLRSVEIEVGQGEQLDIDARVVTGLGCDNTGVGELTVDIIQNTGGSVSYTWLDETNTVIGTNQTQSFSADGEYYIEVTNVTCTVRDTVRIDPNSAFTFDIIPINPSCPDYDNGSISLENFAGGTAPYECAWEGGLSGCMQTDLAEGVYMVTITDDQNCEVIETIPLVSTEVNILFDLIAVNPGCNAGNTGFINIENITGGTAPYMCFWEDPTILSCNPTGLDEGVYNFTVIDVNGCTKDSTVTLTRDEVNIMYEVALTNPTCGGGLGSIFINNIDGPNPPFNTVWLDDPMALGNIRTDLPAGDYTAIISDGLGCVTDTIITLINESDNFLLDIVFNVPDCPNGLDGSISLSNCTGCTCDWGDATLNAQGCTLIGLSPDLYNLVVTDDMGCQKDTFVDLRVNDALEIALSGTADASCFEGTDGSALVDVINDPRAVGNYDFFWSNGEMTSGVEGTINTLPVGDGFVVGFDGICATDTIRFTIGEPSKAILDIPRVQLLSTSCQGMCDGEATLQSTGGTSASGSYMYLWEDGVTGDTRADLCGGLHYITVVDDNLCESLDSVFIIEPVSMVLDTVRLDQISCKVADSGLIEINVEGGCGNYMYAWTDNVSTTSLADLLVAGTYTVTVTDDCGCQLMQDFVLEESSEMDVIPIQPSMPNCLGETQAIGIESVSGGTGTNYTYSINFGDRIPIDSVQQNLPGMYILNVFDEAGCAETITVVIPEPAAFNVDLGSDLELDLGDTETILNATPTGGTGPFTYDWNTTEEFECLNPECSEIRINPGSFAYFQVLITDSNGCQSVDDISIDVKAVRNVYLPNSFNPNFDPPNNRFMILTGQGVEEIVYLRIYDRWGNLMFDKENIMAPTNPDMGWDGRRGNGANSDCEQGVYVYIAEIKFQGTDQAVQYKGSVTLFR